ncbi:MAG TPA: protease modulator HflC [Verrucomicrobiae bacterium]
MKRNLTTIVIGALLLIIFALLLFVFQVRQSEMAIVTTFGKPTARAYDQPGAYFKWPWPIQKIYKFDQRVQNFSDKFSEGSTADRFTLMTMVYIGWRITDPSTFFQKFRGGSVAVAENQLEGMILTAKNAVVGKHLMTDFVSADPEGTKLDAIEKEILTAVQEQTKSAGYGLEIQFLGIKKIGLPEAVTESVFTRMKSEREKYISESQSKGESDATKIRSSAERRAAEVINNAVADATRIKSLGEAAAAQSFLVFQQNPPLAEFLLGLTALEASTKEHTTIILDQSKPPFNLFSGFFTNLVTK